VWLVAIIFGFVLIFIGGMWIIDAYFDQTRREQP